MGSGVENSAPGDTLAKNGYLKYFRGTTPVFFYTVCSIGIEIPHNIHTRFPRIVVERTYI